MLNTRISKKKLQSMRTRETVMDAAARRFGENGYAGCSLDGIAHDAGITKGAIYSHFDSKSELFIAIIARAYNRSLERVNELKASSTFVDALIGFLYECMSNPDFPIPHKLWAEILAAAHRDSEVKSIFVRCQSDCRGVIEKWMRDGMEAGEITPTINIISATDMLFVIGNGLVMRLVDDDNLNYDEAFALIETTIRHLLCPRAIGKDD